jgi:hypothetical protein
LARKQGRALAGPETPAPETTVVRDRRIAAKTIRLRDKEHCKFVATQPCVVCGRTPAEAHHICFAQPRALNRKVSDEYTVHPDPKTITSIGMRDWAHRSAAHPA